MIAAAEIRAVARLDLAEVLRSRWIFFCAATYALLAGVFVLVGMRESSLLGFTGMGRVLLSFTHALLLLLPLLALTATASMVNRARDDGSFELLFTMPLRRTSWFVGTSVVRYLVLVVPLVVLMAGMGLYGQMVRGQEVPWPFLWRSLAVCASLLLCFAGIGVAISTFVRHPAKATTYVILTWALAVALLDFGLIGLMLKWQLNPRAVFTLAALNPVQDARMALLSSLEPDLGTFGPVGFYLANRIGGGALFLLGLVWPAVVGLGAWTAALWRFRRGDLL
jgi:ABC-2 type transport system permease protein